MKNLAYIEVFFVYIVISTVGLAQPECGRKPSCTCGDSHTVIQNQTSVLYQLKGKRVTIFQSCPADPHTLGILVPAWLSRPSTSTRNSSYMLVSSRPNSQVKESGGSVIINPMNESVNGSQFKYQVVNLDSKSNDFSVFYESDWTTALLGDAPSIEAPSRINVTLGCPLNITIEVTGNPTASVSLTHNGNDIEDKYQLDNHLLRFGPVEESHAGNYTARASNCFGDGDASIHVDVLVPASIVSMTGKDTTKCGDSIALECVARGNPKPSITWTNPSSNVYIEGTIAEGNHYYRSVLHVYHVSAADEGEYSCTARNNVGQICSATGGIGHETVTLPVSITRDKISPSYCNNLTSASCSPNIREQHVTNDTAVLAVSVPAKARDNLFGYIVIIDDGKTTATATIQTETEDNMILIPGLTPNTTYNVSVQALYNDCKQTELSAVSVHTQDRPGWAPQIGDTGNTIIECHSLGFDIVHPDDGVDNVTEFEVRYWTSENKNRDENAIGVGTEFQLAYSKVEKSKSKSDKTISVKLEGLKEETAYSIEIKPKNIYGYGKFSSSLSLATTICPSSLSIPFWAWIISCIIFLAMFLLFYLFYLFWEKKQKKRQIKTSGSDDVIVNITLRRDNETDNIEIYATVATARGTEEPNTDELKQRGPSEDTEPYAYATTEIALDGETAKSSTCQQKQTSDIYAQLTTKKTETVPEASASVVIYAQPYEPKKEKEDQPKDQYAQVNKDKVEQGESFYANLDESAMTRMNSAVGHDYAELNEVQPPSEDEDTE